jgi:hypothetical protein
VDLSEPEPTVVTKATKCVTRADSSFNSLSNYHRVAKLSYPRSHKNTAPKKPSGLTGPAKAITIHPTTTTADEDDESSTTIEDEEIVDNIEYSTSSKDSLV